jgi:HAD superfamily hydrolase (TIGR01459 family)
MICANPDRVVQRGDKMVFCSGALADVYESLGGRVTMAGKPYPPIYTLALDEASRLLDRPVDRRRVLCVGDGIPTDVKGANNQGLDLLFVAAGIHGEEARGDDGALDPARVTALLERESASATYAMLDLAW